MATRILVLTFLALMAFAAGGPVAAQDASPATSSDSTPTTADSKPQAPEAKPGDEPTSPTGPLPGHSYHGEVFDEGPRQQAYLMTGMPKIHFPVTTKSSEAQAFIEQGVGQLHRPPRSTRPVRWPTGAWPRPISTTAPAPRNS